MARLEPIEDLSEQLIQKNIKQIFLVNVHTYMLLLFLSTYSLCRLVA